MELPAGLLQELQPFQLGPVTAVTRLGGSSTAALFRLSCARGACVIKWRADPPEQFFAAEAHGLAALADSGAIPTPRVHAVTRRFICLDYLKPDPVAEQHCWARLGECLAALHAEPRPQFGFDRDNYCGLSPQPNAPLDDGFAFFAERRLLFQGRRAAHHGLLDSPDLHRLERLCQRLPELLPQQPAVLLHGDLWHGNLLWHGQQPVLIDPACYWGWAEAELAMTRLFGGFPPAFYRAYEAAAAIDGCWVQRCELYNLYHLLNHLNLFGSSYYPEVTGILRRFS